jgi:formate dehydrogenase subunit gamma
VLHLATALVLIAFSFGHIYIGTIGTEGALEGMTTGQVDVAWAEQHHDLWLKEVQQQQADKQNS